MNISSSNSHTSDQFLLCCFVLLYNWQEKNQHVLEKDAYMHNSDLQCSVLFSSIPLNTIFSTSVVVVLSISSQHKPFTQTKCTGSTQQIWTLLQDHIVAYLIGIVVEAIYYKPVSWWTSVDINPLFITDQPLYGSLQKFSEKCTTNSHTAAAYATISYCCLVTTCWLFDYRFGYTCSSYSYLNACIGSYFCVMVPTYTLFLPIPV